MCMCVSVCLSVTCPTLDNLKTYVIHITEIVFHIVCLYCRLCVRLTVLIKVSYYYYYYYSNF